MERGGQYIPSPFVVVGVMRLFCGPKVNVRFFHVLSRRVTDCRRERSMAAGDMVVVVVEDVGS